MPFLYDLVHRGYLNRVKTVPGFTQETAMMTGKFPVETDHFTWYRYAPKTSPFKWLKPFGIFRNLPSFRFYGPIKVGIRTATRLITGRRYPDPAHIPLDLLPYFERIAPKSLRHLPDLYSICRSSGHTYYDLMYIYNFINTKRCNDMFQTICKSIEEGIAYDLYLIHVGELDILGHRFGARPELFVSYLREIDAWIRELYELTHRHGHTCSLVVVSDHGMMNVKGAVDITNKLSQLKLRLHKDYLYFLDSTMARFWFMNKQAQREVEAMLQTIPHGHIISPTEKNELHINFQHNQYGDLLFWLEEGYIIFPNFFQANNSNMPKGMHGYMNDTDGALVIYSDDKTVKENLKDPVPLVDVFSVVLELAGF